MQAVAAMRFDFCEVSILEDTVRGRNSMFLEAEERKEAIMRDVVKHEIGRAHV